MTIRVVICDDQDLVRDGLRAILSTAPGIEVVGEASDGDEVLEVVAVTSPDVVLMDLKMPGTGGVAATRNVVGRFEQTRVLVLTTYGDPEWVDDAIKAGASGYLLKDAPRVRLIEAIRGTAEGRTHVDPGVAGHLFERVSTAPAASPDPAVLRGLTEREVDVLKALGHGLTNAEIAERLFLSEGTVRNYISALIGKLEVADRTQAAVIAIRSGIVDTG